MRALQFEGRIQCFLCVSVHYIAYSVWLTDVKDYVIFYNVVLSMQKKLTSITQAQLILGIRSCERKYIA